MGIRSLYVLAQEVQKQVQDPEERSVLFEWVRVTRDVICEQDVKWNLEALRDTGRVHGEKNTGSKFGTQRSSSGKGNNWKDLRESPMQKNRR